MLFVSIGGMPSPCIPPQFKPIIINQNAGFSLLDNFIELFLYIFTQVLGNFSAL